MSIDTDRLIKDLLGGAAAALDGPDPVSDELRGMSRAWLILAAALEDGEYDLDPKDRTIAEVDTDWDLPENMFPGYDSDDLDRIVVEKDRKENR